MSADTGDINKRVNESFEAIEHLIQVGDEQVLRDVATLMLQGLRDYSAHLIQEGLRNRYLEGKLD